MDHKWWIVIPDELGWIDDVVVLSLADWTSVLNNKLRVLSCLGRKLGFWLKGCFKHFWKTSDYERFWVISFGMGETWFFMIEYDRFQWMERVGECFS